MIELTGQKMSRLQRQQQKREFAYRVLRVVARPEPRAVLHERIEQRFERMLQEGFLEEMRTLRERPGLRRDMPSMRCVGYRQAWSHLEGEIDRDEMRRKAVVATRQLAKRQLTWLRRETDALWYDSSAEKARDSVIRKVDRFLELRPRST